MVDEFTIIVPVYNREKLVERTLDSILAQSYRPLHLVVVDNASTDGSARVVTEWGERHADNGFAVSILSEPTQGAVHARNRGLRAVRGDKLMFFDSDDTMRPDLVETAMRTFRENPDAQIVYWRNETINLDGSSFSPHFSTRNVLRNHIFHSLLSTQNYAVRKSFIENAGGWASNMTVWDDWELGVRLLLTSPEVVGINRILVDKYAQAESITGKDFTSKEGRWEKALDQVANEINFSGRDDRNSLLRLIDYRRIILAAKYRREGNIVAANRLVEKTLDAFRGSQLQRMALKFAYLYTSAGLRGAASLVGYLL